MEDIHVQLAGIKGQLERLLSDWESEKDHRVDLNKRVRALEDDKIIRDTTLKNVGILWGVIGTVVGWALSIIISSLMK